MPARASYQPGLTDQVYQNHQDLLRDLVTIYQDEMRCLATDCVEYVQFDEGFNVYVNKGWREAVQRGGQDPERVLAADIAAENACWDLLQPDKVVRASHLCRGSRTRERGSGDYEWINERLLNELHVERFLFEYDSELQGGFEPLRFLPKGKVVVLGLITTKDSTLEPQDLLLRRIEEAARYCSVDQLALSPQCGFSGSALHEFMTEDEQWRKLELVLDTARRVWE
jgi:5-methyltetrahydropteroyltriglutamate--homocysteine methyltransferase